LGGGTPIRAISENRDDPRFLQLAYPVSGLANGQDAVGYQLEITFQLQLVVAVCEKCWAAGG
jgi:hypothetical protein